MLRSQQYSDLVFKEVERLLGRADFSHKRYKSLCRRAGGIFRTVGLIQFMAFIEAKADDDNNDHYKALGEQLRRELHELSLVEDFERDAFLRIVRTSQLPEYMHISRSVLELLQWHKRISEVMIVGEADDHDEGE
ncbi:MAG: type III-B CRISPR module-associated protein Cmr5 [Desulfovibrio sp. S3730MH75]|nr:MAG: type III-B CRISPR module-associated protein Cmr5 [Desulfovibrio sp. S3730MH75]